MDDVAAEQARQNRTTQRQWQMYADHRARIERLIVPTHPNGKLCVLGAGNCNDLDLQWLIQVYAHVHLVDLDLDALKVATVRQQVTNSPRLHLHAPFDLTNIAPDVTTWLQSPPTAATLAQATTRVLQPPSTPWGPCDTVLSPCVLTQTLTPARDALRPHSLEAPARTLKLAVRARHLNLIAASLAPQGKGILVIDAVSSEKVLDLPRIPAQEVPAALDRLIAANKHFRDLDPHSLQSAARAAGLTATLPTPPWLWHLGLRKSFIVYALTLRLLGSHISSDKTPLRIREI